MKIEVPPCGCELVGIVDSTSCYCSVEDLLRIIRRRYSLAVLSVIHRLETARYVHIANTLHRASSSTLAETLRALEASGLVRRVARKLAAHPDYVLTDSGTKLISRLQPLLEDIQDSDQ